MPSQKSPVLSLSPLGFFALTFFATRLGDPDVLDFNDGFIAWELEDEGLVGINLDGDQVTATFPETHNDTILKLVGFCVVHGIEFEISEEDEIPAVLNPALVPTTIEYTVGETSVESFRNAVSSVGATIKTGTQFHEAGGRPGHVGKNVLVIYDPFADDVRKMLLLSTDLQWLAQTAVVIAAALSSLAIDERPEGPAGNN